MFDLPYDEILPLSKEHVFWTWSAQAKVNPIPVKTARGVYFWDTSGKRYLDFNSMTMCVNIGHGDERVIAAIQEQAAELPYAAPGMTTRVRALASQLVAQVSPGGKLSKVLFTLGGADANENAIKLARGYTGRFKILARYRSYHGASAGAIAATGDPRRVALNCSTVPYQSASLGHTDAHIGAYPSEVRSVHMSHFIIWSKSAMYLGTPNGHASTQFEQPMQRGLSADWTMPFSVCLIASAGHTWAQVGSSQCMQTIGAVWVVVIRSRCSRWISDCPRWVPHSMQACTHASQPMHLLWSITNTGESSIPYLMPVLREGRGRDDPWSRRGRCRV